MSSRDEAYSRPERVLLVLARGTGDCRGKAIRFSDGAEFRFRTVRELAAWLANPTPPAAIDDPPSS